MRTLSDEEVEAVAGGNLTSWGYAALGLAGAFYTGAAIGNSVNNFNSQYSGMSFGESIYRQFH